MRILHLASFAGNSGDSLNHNGFRTWMEAFFPDSVTWSDFEIRDVYRGEKTFANDLVDESKRADLLVIGGGNYLELWPENTSTGTSLDLSDETIDAIHCPIFFNALGVDAGQGIGSSAKQNFTHFINKLIGSDKFLVTVRNDGSFQTICSVLGNAEKIVEIPDHGFFGKLEVSDSCPDATDETIVGVNIAVDMPNLRFSEFENTEAFLTEFSRALVEIHAQTQCVFRFFPHVKSDLSAISKIIDLLPDMLARQYVQVVRYDTSSKGSLKLFEEYLGCSLILANRFHANVFAISSLLPVIGISNYPQISSLYSRMSLDQFCFDVRRPGFMHDLAANAVLAISDPDSTTERLRISMKVVKDSRANFEGKLVEWLYRQSLLHDMNG